MAHFGYLHKFYTVG